MLTNSYLLVPSCVEGNGTGHLRRIVDIYIKLKENFDVFVYVPIKQIPVLHKSILIENINSEDLFLKKLPENIIWHFIIVDYRDSPSSLIGLLAQKGFLIGIDEGGDQRGWFDYLIDIIPSSGFSVKANYSSVGLINLPERRDCKKKIKFQKILISFGGEDYASLTKNLLDFFEENNYFTNSEITVVGKNSFDRTSFKDSTIFIDSMSNLKSVIYEYDLVFTSFGFTAFESLASGVPFVLLDPSSYHHKLSQNCNFVEIGVEKPVKYKLDQFLQTGKNFSALQNKYIPEIYTNIGDFISTLKNTDTNCPVCHSKGLSSNIIKRFQNRNFYNCPECGITYQVYFKQLKNSYRKDYFFDDYKDQYGCTYLEDFENIKKLSVPRLKIINKINKSGLELLDIGCAYGPFLIESEKNGYIPAGVEIISDAVNYVRSKLGFLVYSGNYETMKLDKKYDIVTMWYVIEHFADLRLVLTKVNKQLNTGGVFAFSTPNSSGISAFKNKFLKNSPTDHISVWNPKISNKILKRFGFKIRRIRITGHHAERFSSIPLFKTKTGYGIFTILSKTFALGDTFEVYAEKMKEIDD